ncbi:MAG: hypothetical protein IH609_03685 [Dehalococcoidia bacterium]|nr:hypothetical protein [Dehalococcoidia bacterium]
MKSIATRVILISIALGTTLFGLADTATASHVELQIVGPAEVAVGHSVGVQATLRSADDDLPIAGAAVTFYTHASFDGVSSKVELGKAVSGKDGVAVLDYQPRTSGEHELVVEYLTPGSSEPEVATWSHVAAGGGSQMYRSTAGMDVPGLNVWLIIAVVSTVWLILLSVAVRVIAIARADDDVAVAAGHSSPGHAGAVSS